MRIILFTDGPPCVGAIHTGQHGTAMPSGAVHPNKYPCPAHFVMPGYMGPGSARFWRASARRELSGMTAELDHRRLLCPQGGCDRDPNVMQFHLSHQQAGLPMDFTLPPEIEDLRQRTRAFIEEHVLPLESDPENFSEHENIPLARLAPVQARAKAAGLWAPQSPQEFGGMALPIVAWAVLYEEAARSIFGPLALNCMAPDDGNMNLLARAGTPAQKEKWLRPIVEGRVKSSFAMTEPAPGGGSDPGMIMTR